jgi:hypothetical protein
VPDLDGHVTFSGGFFGGGFGRGGFTTSRGGATGRLRRCGASCQHHCADEQQGCQQPKFVTHILFSYEKVRNAKVEKRAYK